MESTLSCLNECGEATGKYLIGVEGRSFEAGLDTDMTDIVPLPTPDDDKNDYRSHSNGNGKVCLESDESDYYSDCSLGSLNSLYLNLKHKRPNLNTTNGTNETQSRNENSDTSKTDGTTVKNVVAITTRIATNRKFYNRKKYEKPITKLNVFYFYGMQNTHSRKSCVRQLKRKHHPAASKIRVTKSSAAVYTYKRNVNKLRAWSAKRKHRKCMTDKHLIRHRLKETIPLLKWNDDGQVKKNRKQDNEMQLTSPVEKSQRNEIEFITGRETGTSEAGRSSRTAHTDVPDVFSTRDFTDWTDDFEDALMIDDIVDRLFDEDHGDQLIGARVPGQRTDDGRTAGETTQNVRR